MSYTKGGGQNPERAGARKGGGAKGGEPKGGEPKSSRFFSLLRPKFHSFFTLWGLLVELWPGFEAVGHPNSALLGSFCASPGGLQTVVLLSFFLSVFLSFFLPSFLKKWKKRPEKKRRKKRSEKIKEIE